ncbi:MAG TPA: biotin--[acetyl-CoA-carboxylase] ligase [Pyrinomonadaceae bacterium]
MSRWLRPTILRFDSLPSTNTEAARQAALGAPEGLCVVSREQTEGRGRRDRLWVSPSDAGLYFSIILRPRIDTALWPLITLAASLAVRDALLEACALNVDIKWPNDIIAGDRKLCGILAETVETETGRACVLGIGINLRDTAFPPELLERAASVEALTGGVHDIEGLLQSLLRSLSRHYRRLHEAHGAEETVRDWSQSSSYSYGKRVRVCTGGEIFDGITRGLESDGALRVEIPGGEIKTVRAGDVTSLRKRQK